MAMVTKLKTSGEWFFNAGLMMTGRRGPAQRPAQNQQGIGDLVQGDPGAARGADPAQQDHQRQADEGDHGAEQTPAGEGLAEKAHGQQQGDQRIEGDQQRGGVGLDVLIPEFRNRL